MPAVLGTIALFFVLAVVFLESGANSGKLVLEQREAYGRGTIEYVGGRNLYLVRLADGQFLALSDLDAANRANPRHRCRAAPIAISDPTLPGLLERYRSRVSVPAAGSTLLFREDCNGAVYDLAGQRVDNDAEPNLDRYPVSFQEDGRVTVDVSRRQCTRQDGAARFVARRCE